MKIESPVQLAETAGQLNARPRPPMKLLVSLGTCGIAAGTQPVLKAIRDEITERRLENAIEVSEVGCMGLCYAEPVIMLLDRESGKRLISSRLANTLGITRSAVSQMVNKLEEREIVCRIPDKTDRKIAYIELSEKAQDIYDRMKERVNLFVRKILEKLGEEKIGNFLTSANEFLDVCGEVLREMPQAERV